MLRTESFSNYDHIVSVITPPAYVEKLERDVLIALNAYNAGPYCVLAFPTLINTKTIPVGRFLSQDRSLLFSYTLWSPNMQNGIYQAKYDFLLASTIQSGLVILFYVVFRHGDRDGITPDVVCYVYDGGWNLMLGSNTNHSSLLSITGNDVTLSWAIASDGEGGYKASPRVKLNGVLYTYDKTYTLTNFNPDSYIPLGLTIVADTQDSYQYVRVPALLVRGVK